MMIDDLALTHFQGSAVSLVFGQDQKVVREDPGIQ